MSEMVLAQRYAQALFNQSLAQGVLEDIYQSVHEVAGLNEQVPDFKVFIHNPLLSPEEQEKILKALFADKTPALLFQFLNFLVSKGRLNILENVAEAFEALYLSHHQRVRVLVQSAKPLDDGLKEELLARLKKITGCALVPEWKVDPAMIGGIRVYSAGKLYEYSFKNELRDYKRRALERI